MSTDLRTQLAAYGDLFTADLDAVTVEDAMSTRTGEGKVMALEPVQRHGDGKKHRRGVLLAATVFIIVVAAGLALAFALRGTTEDVVEVPAPPFETPEEAIAAFDAGIRAGDYEAWKTLFVDGVDSFFGTEGATDQRKQERYEWNSIAASADITNDFRCAPNDVVTRSWTCTMPAPRMETAEILAAAGVLGGPVALVELDISLSEDGLISRVSELRPVDVSGAHGQALFDFTEWSSAHDPELWAAEEVMFFRSNHEVDPLPMPIAEMVERAQSAVDDYVEFLESGGTARAIPAPPFETGQEAARAFFEALGSGDYAAFQGLFASGTPNYFGDASVSEQRLRERFEFEAADDYDIDAIQCEANPAVASAWTCNKPMQDESWARILIASELQPDTPLAEEFDILLSATGFIQRVSEVRVAGTGVAAGPITQFGIQPWLVANNPSLDENLHWLWGTGDPETFPLTMTPAEMATQWVAAIDEYAATLDE